ncbi:hypothetical protein Hanom_Chr10g00900501 [Helianthus anomalus]
MQNVNQINSCTVDHIIDTLYKTYYLPIHPRSVQSPNAESPRLTGNGITRTCIGTYAEDACNTLARPSDSEYNWQRK